MLIAQPWAVYNEIEEYAAEWIENLIALGEIAPGIVDRRSIVDVRPDDYRGFRQVHFFAGIGVWSYALRRAGVPDDAALWTGSCPCQPFSAAGAGGGVDDERHLWPAFFHLIRAGRPPRIYGEQVASKDGLGWLDLVSADLEGEGYSVWTVDTCSAGSGAPHIRQRLRFCADDLRLAAGGVGNSLRNGQPGQRLLGRSSDPETQSDRKVSRVVNDGGSGRLADDSCVRRIPPEGFGALRSAAGGIEGEVRTERFRAEFGTGGAIAVGLGYSGGPASQWDAGAISGTQAREHGARIAVHGREPQRSEYASSSMGNRQPCPTNGFWRDADWLFCRDGKWRPVESGTFPLVDGSAFRVGSGSAFEGRSRQGMLKGYGNAIDAEATIDFIEATLEPDTINLVGDPVDEDLL